jgi:hypothetical protein
MLLQFLGGFGQIQIRDQFAQPLGINLIPVLVVAGNDFLLVLILGSGHGRDFALGKTDNSSNAIRAEIIPFRADLSRGAFQVFQ